MNFRDIIIVILLLMVIFGLYPSAKQFYALLTKQQQLEELQQRADQLKNANSSLNQRVKALDDSNGGQHIDKDMLEELARRRLGYNFPEERYLESTPTLPTVKPAIGNGANGKGTQIPK
ncbi:MAG: septum formation initiator family protein, partial [Alphaproteobacteria bacterium]|nr:septum formation initiator family protein [Alphaproteobacteria bacterium]